MKFDDERGQPLEQTIPASTGRFKEFREQMPRRDGESRAKWKSRANRGLPRGGDKREAGGCQCLPGRCP